LNLHDCSAGLLGKRERKRKKWRGEVGWQKVNARKENGGDCTGKGRKGKGYILWALICDKPPNCCHLDNKF